MVNLLTNKLDGIIFDCDGTLSHIEGIDVLAAQAGVADQVVALTDRAMNETGLTVELYRERLDLIQPTRDNLLLLGERYWSQRSPDVEAVLGFFQALGKAVFVISAGNNPAVMEFAKRLGVPRGHIYAVDLAFDAAGSYVDFDQSSPMTRRGGKREVVAEIQRTYPRVLHIGDGMNDYEVHDVVDRFVGYGGMCRRELIAKQSEFYIDSPSLLGLLPLALTAEEVQNLSGPQLELYEQGLML